MGILTNILPKTGLNSNYSKKNYYELKITRTKGIQEIISLYRDVKDTVEIPNSIQAFNIPLGSSMKYLRRQMGAPILESQCEALQERKILIYKNQFLNTKVYTQFHFYNNRLFIVENHFYTLNDAEHKILQRIFSEKYDLPLNNACNSYKLTDAQGNKLIISKDAYTSMVYLYNNREILLELEEKHYNGSLKSFNQYQNHLSGWVKKI